MGTLENHPRAVADREARRARGGDPDLTSQVGFGTQDTPVDVEQGNKLSQPTKAELRKGIESKLAGYFAAGHVR